MRLSPSKVKFASPCIAFAPVTVHTVLSVDPESAGPAEIPVKFEPSPEKLVAVTTPEIIGPESVNVTVLKPARLLKLFVRISDVIIFFSYLSSK